jgi:hypothetical protein
VTAERLRALTDDELRILVAEIEERAELFDTKVRAEINDELRRRRMELIKGRRS